MTSGQGFGDSSATDSNARLILIAGGQREEFPLSSGRTTIGRDSTNSIQIRDSTVSRSHAAVFREAHEWRIADLGSRNGTLVNDDPVKSARLKSSDRVLLGEALLVFVEQGAPRPSGISAEETGKTEVLTFVSPRTGPSKSLEEAIESPSSVSRSRFSALLQVSGAANDLPHADALITCMNRELSGTLDLSNVRTLMFLPNGRIMLFEDGPGTEVLDLSDHDISGSIVDRVRTTGESVLWRTTDDDTSIADNVEDTASLSSVMCAPIGTPLNMKGVLMISRRQGLPVHQIEDLEYLAAMSCIVEAGLEHMRVRSELRQAHRLLGEQRRSKYDIVGNSPAIAEVFEFIDRVAPVDAGVLILGESGTGKELVARAIFEQSERRTKPFEVVNCGAIPESLAESELFGHVAGAFTSAHLDKKGRFEIADGGTLFLDEVGELPLEAQTKLLRALQFGEVQRVGGEMVKVDVRVIAATNVDLRRKVDDGEFREDLYFRLNVLTIELPPLRDRVEDLPLLIDYFLISHSKTYGVSIQGISNELKEAFEGYSWPGNVRELKHLLESMVVLGKHEILQLDDVPAGRLDPEGAPDDVSDDESSEWMALPLSEIQRRHILRMMGHTGDNKSEAARLLEIDRGTLAARLRSYGYPTGVKP